MVLAQLQIDNPEINPVAKFGDFASILNQVIPIIVGFAGVVAFGVALYGAYMVITAAGDPEKFKAAQKVFKSAIIGVIIVILSFLAMKVLEFILGIDLPI